MGLDIVFDYNDERILINDRDKQKTVNLNCRESDSDRPAIPHSGFKNVYPVVLLNYILHHSYRVLPSVLLLEQEDVYEYYDRQEQSKEVAQLLGESGKDAIRTTLIWLNKYLANKGLEVLKTVGIGDDDESIVRISDELNSHNVTWRIKTPDKRGKINIEKYCVSNTWISDNRTEELENYFDDLRCEEIRNQYQDYDTKDLYKSEFKSEEEIKINRRIKSMALKDEAMDLEDDAFSDSPPDRYRVESVSDAVYWKDRAIKYDGTVPAVFYKKYLDENMLPHVAIADTGEEFNNLSEYVCNHMLGSNCHLTLLQGKSGSGKSFSLHSTAYGLSVKRDAQIRQNYTIVIDAQRLKEISLLEYIREYYMNSPVYDLFTEGIVGELIEKENKNVIIMIDGLDRISIDRLHEISNKIIEIGQWQQQNIYFILASSNVNTIVQFGGLINNGLCFDNYEKVIIQGISTDLLEEDEKELKALLDDNRELCTPLFISYYRGLSNLAYRMKIKAYVGDVGKMDFRTIRTYYDLFNARMDLLMKHAETEGADTICYKYLLPMLAYYLFTERDLDNVDIGIINLLFPPIWKRAGFAVHLPEELKWGIDQIWDNNPDFSRLSPAYKLLMLLNTGVIVPESSRESFDPAQQNEINIQSDEFIFDSFEFREYLAARYVASIIKECEVQSTVQQTMQKVLECTSYASDDLSRVEKMRFIPFGYYLFLELTKDSGKVEWHDTNSVSNMETFILLLAGNIAYERRRVWEGSVALINKCLDEMLMRVTNEKPAAADWRLLDAINVISYENNGLRLLDQYADSQKKGILDDIIWSLNGCIALVMKDIYCSYGNEDTFRSIIADFKEVGLGSDGSSIQFSQLLIAIIEEQGVDALALNGYPYDYVAALLSNLGASHLQAAKHYNGIANMGLRDAHLDLADTLHHLAYSIRSAIVEHTDQRSIIENTSIIRSLITLATDSYFRADYASDYKEIKEHISRSESFYQEALNRQGISVLGKDDLSLSTDPDNLIDTSNVMEKVRPDAQAFVIYPRMCGGVYLLYTKAKERFESGGCPADEEEKEIYELIDKQYVYLLASYLFLNKECLKEGSDSEYDVVKLDIESKYIDQLWKDVEDKYADSLSKMNDRKEEGFALLNRICNLYKALHPNIKECEIVIGPDQSSYKIKLNA